jgi:hypothetical protein
MGLLLVDAISLGSQQNRTNTAVEDILVVNISVTDANGNPRNGLNKDSATFTSIQGGLSGGTVNDLISIGRGFYGLMFSAGQPDVAGGPFPSFPNSDNVFGVAISDAGDAGQTLVRVTVSGRP